MKKLAILLVVAAAAPALGTIGDVVSVDLTPANPADVTLGGEWRVGFDEPWKTYCAQRTDRPPGQGEFWQYTGSGTATINYSLPAAEYKVTWWGAPASWGNGKSWQFSIDGTGVTEAGTLYPNQLPKTLHPLPIQPIWKIIWKKIRSFRVKTPLKISKIAQKRPVSPPRPGRQSAR